MALLKLHHEASTSLSQPTITTPSFVQTLILLLLIHLSNSAPSTPSTNSQTLHPNLHLHQIQNLTLGPAHCTNAPEWDIPNFIPYDCTIALSTFRAINVTHYGIRPFEFLAPGAAPIHALPTMRTPLRVTEDTCTLTIAMLGSFPAAMLPGAGPHPPRRFEDVASFEELWDAGADLDIECLQYKGLMGWSRAGGRDSVGVFFWGTGSWMDRVVRGGMMGEEL